MGKKIGNFKCSGLFVCARSYRLGWGVLARSVGRLCSTMSNNNTCTVQSMITSHWSTRRRRRRLLSWGGFFVLGGIFNSLLFLTMLNGVFLFTFTEWLTDRYWELQNQSTHAEASKPRRSTLFFSIRLCAFLSWLKLFRHATTIGRCSLRDSSMGPTRLSRFFVAWHDLRLKLKLPGSNLSKQKRWIIQRFLLASCETTQFHRRVQNFARIVYYQHENTHDLCWLGRHREVDQ